MARITLQYGDVYFPAIDSSVCRSSLERFMLNGLFLGSRDVIALMEAYQIPSPIRLLKRKMSAATLRKATHKKGKKVHASTPGGFAQFAAVDARTLHRLPDEVTGTQGAWVEPASVALRAVRRSEIKVGDRAIVFGAGPILGHAWGQRRGKNPDQGCSSLRNKLLRFTLTSPLVITSRVYFTFNP